MIPAVPSHVRAVTSFGGSHHTVSSEGEEKMLVRSSLRAGGPVARSLVGCCLVACCFVWAAAGPAPVLVVSSEAGTRTAPVGRSGDLSGAAFQGINSVTFRSYPLTPANGNTMDFSGMTLNGTVVPEPGALACVALGGVGLLRRRGR